MSDSICKIPPGATFYLKVSAVNSDGTLDLNSESPTGGLKIQDALTPLVSEADEYGLEGYVYKCHPIMRVLRPPVKIIDFRKKKGDKS